MSNEENFIVRAYGYGELALLYFPNSTKKSAGTQLGRWIRNNQSLNQELIEAGFRPGNRILTPRQVEILVKIIGIPS